jgi:hypothetical protein
MKALSTLLVFMALALGLAPSAQGAFGLEDFDVTFTNQDGSPATQAGSHPFAMTTSFDLNTTPGKVLEGEIKDLGIEQIVGLVGEPGAVPRCQTDKFLESNPPEGRESKCPDSTAIGVAVAQLSEPKSSSGVPAEAAVYNLVPPPGVAAKIGFVARTVPVTVELGVNPEPPHNVIAKLTDTSQAAQLFGSSVTLWGDPANPVHDPFRGFCAALGTEPGGVIKSRGSCSVGTPEVPFLTLPRACAGPLTTSYVADSWQEPGGYLINGDPDLSDPNWLSGSAETHDASEPPVPLGITGCGKLPFHPTITAKPTTLAAESPTGLDFSLDVKDEGLTSAKEGAVANSDIKKAVVTLPQGFSTNPSLAEGLNVCSEADLARETVNSAPGEGCPNASKIGTVEVETPLLEENVNGSIFAATPYENSAGNSLLALYMVLKNPTLGIMIKQPIKVEPDPVTGQLTTVAENLPQLPFSHFKLHFREGTRSPLASPPGCGSYDARAVLTPWSGTAPITTTTTFQIIVGPESGPCPSGGTPPFHPGLEAGTINNAAGSYSPFYVHLTRKDSEQEITHFSIKLPPGLVGKLAGIPFCPDAAIVAAKARTGPHGGAEELASPSCPAASEIGHTLVGAGVGPSLAYAPGKVYLAGPYHGSALSIAAITAAKVGPFDLGTVVVREALRINPETAEVFIDATGSDPIPHIIQGIPVHLRDIRVYVDRPNFTLNPTSCAPTSTASTVLGSGLDFGSEADDQPITVTSRFQAADCASLGFAPKLALSLKGGTKRNQVPAFKAVLTYPKGSYANIAKAQVTLPKSAFLDNEHIGTICTRPVFNEGAVPGEKCPAASVYGHAQAITPLLDEPIEGPVFLRANGGERNLPDLVAALHSGKINVNLVGFIDSVHKKGSETSLIRNTFALVPDAPVTKFTLEMAGGKKGLLINSTNLCKSTNKALAAFTGQNGKRHDFEPVLKPLGCKGKGKPKKANKRQGRPYAGGWATGLLGGW